MINQYKRILIMFFFCGYLNASNETKQVDAFLKTLSTKKKSYSASKNNSDSPIKTSFFKQLKQQESQAKKQQQKEIREYQQKESEGLNYIVHFYGNPQYQTAMNILNDASLQASYEQDLNALHIFFFDYSEKVVKKYHKAHVANSGNQQSIDSFLSSVHNVSNASKSSKKSSAQVNGEGATQKVASFLATLKG